MKLSRKVRHHVFFWDTVYIHSYLYIHTYMHTEIRHRNYILHCFAGGQKSVLSVWPCDLALLLMSFNGDADKQHRTGKCRCCMQHVAVLKLTSIFTCACTEVTTGLQQFIGLWRVKNDVIAKAKARDSFIARLTGTKPDQPCFSIIGSGSWSARAIGAATLMRPFIARVNEQLDPRQQLANTPPPQSTTLDWPLPCKH